MNPTPYLDAIRRLADATDESISADSFMTLRAFLLLLPDATKRPKIALDGEEGVFLSWKGAAHQVVVGIAGLSLYAVVDPGTMQSRHIEELLFDGSIPREIEHAISMTKLVRDKKS